MFEVVSMFSQAPEPDPISRVEQGLLAALISNPEKAIARLPVSFSSSHYLDELHRDIHEAVVSTQASSADLLKAILSLTNEDASYVAALMGAFMGLGSVQRYAEAVTEAHHRRSVVAIAEKMLADAKRSTLDLPVAGIMTSALAQLDAMLAGTHHIRAGRSLDAAMDAALAHAERAAKGELIAGRSTGMTTVDNAIGGLENSTFNVLGARPGAGKTSLAVQWAVSVARQCKQEGAGGVLGFSLEMSATQLGRRVLSEVSKVSAIDLKRGRITGRVEALNRARHELAGLPIWVEDAGGQNLPAIRQKTRAALRRYGRLSLIWIDHIQIVIPDDIDRRNGGTQAVGRVSNALRDLSKEFDCPVLCLSQLNRGLLQRDDKRPNLGDLRQAGDIEQDADVVMFLHREEMFLSKSEPEPIARETPEKHGKRIEDWRQKKQNLAGKAELICEKVRDGDPSTVSLLFEGCTTSFREPESRVHATSQTNLSDWNDRYFEGGPPGGY